MKKYISFFGLFLYAIGVVGGIGYAIYASGWVIAIAVLVLGVMAYPTARKLFKNLTD